MSVRLSAMPQEDGDRAAPGGDTSSAAPSAADGPTRPVLDYRTPNDARSDSRTSSLAVLRHRGFRLFWGGNLISGCGVWVQNLVIGWLIIRLSRSSFWLGVYGCASLLPTLVLSLVGGAVADRVDRRRIMIGAQLALMLIALVLSMLAHLGVIAMWQIVLTTVLTGAAVALNSPAYQATIPDLVPPDELTAAIGLNSVQFNVARIVGHSLAGVVMVAAGEAGCFLFNALTYLAMLYALWRIDVPSRHRPADRTPLLHRVKEGLGYVRGQPALLHPVLIVAAVSFFGLPYFFLLPAVATDVLHAGARGLGYLTASVSVGGLAAGLLMTRLTRRWPKGSVIATAALSFWATLFAFACSRHYGLSVALLILLGLSLVLTIATVNNLLQVLAPPDMRGRVMSIQGMAVNGLVPLGSLLVGGLAQAASPPAALKVMAGLGFLVTLPGAARIFEVRRRPVPAAPLPQVHPAGPPAPQAGRTL